MDGWTARQPLSARFRFYVTVTYIQCSVQRHFLNLCRRRHKGQGFMCRQPPSAFLPGRKPTFRESWPYRWFLKAVCLMSVSELCGNEKGSSCWFSEKQAREFPAAKQKSLASVECGRSNKKSYFSRRTQNCLSYVSSSIHPFSNPSSVLQMKQRSAVLVF